MHADILPATGGSERGISIAPGPAGSAMFAGTLSATVRDVTLRRELGKDVCMDFALRYDKWYRPFASLIGLGPLWTTIRVADGRLIVRHGWAFRFQVPVDKIEAVDMLRERPMSWGVHQATDGWLVNGSPDGIVKITFTEPVSPQRAAFATLFGGSFRALYLSLTEPKAFIAALMPSRSP